MKTKRPSNRRKKQIRQRYPRGWNLKRVQKVIEYYDKQTDEEAVAEYEAGMELDGQSMMLVPTKLVPEIEKLIASRKQKKRSA